MTDNIIIKKEKILDDDDLTESIFIDNPKPTAITDAHVYTDENNVQRSYSHLNTNSQSGDRNIYTGGAGSLCGEVFVTHNARKWTFVCTYCSKATRDIGEFICHITLKHMGGGTADLFDSDKEYNEHNINGQDQEYFDYGNFLDVNVHVGKNSDETLIGEKKPKIKSTMTKDNFVINLLANDNNSYCGEDDSTTTEWVRQQQQYNMGSNYDNDKDDDDDNELEESFQINAYAKDHGEEYENDNEYEENECEDEKASSIISSSKRKTKSKSGGIHCSICNKTFPFYSLYRYHMVKHTNQTPFICPMCKRGFKSKQSLSYHKKTHFREHRYHKCQVCSIECNSKSALVSHMATHECTSGSATFLCQICNSTFTSSGERELHIKKQHIKDLPFKCDFCEKRFREENHLEQHLRLHRQYYCRFCKKEFSTTIAGPRPHACPSCEKIPKVQAKLKSLKRRRTSASTTTVVDSFNTTTSTTVAEEPYVYPLGLYENTQYPKLKHSTLYNDNDYIEDDDSKQREEPLGVNSKGKQRVPCKYCVRTYTHTSALNYHIRQKHPEFWN